MRKRVMWYDIIWYDDDIRGDDDNGYVPDHEWDCENETKGVRA